MGFSTKISNSKRITSDNKYLKSVQVKDVKSIITDDCVLHLDCDSIPYFAASQQDDNYIIVTHKKSGREMEFKNKTEFKGSSNKLGVITQKSWLGAKNLEQQAKGKPEFTLDDFTIEQKKRLRGDKTSCMAKAINYMKDYIDSILTQSGCATLICYLGSGTNHRYLVKLPEVYKGSRKSQERPLLLKDCRQWVEDNYPHKIVVGEESDDVCQREAYKGSLHYHEKGLYSHALAAVDKDSLGLPCLNFCYQKKGPFWVNPNPWIIEDWEVTGGVGEIEMLDGKCKTTSLLMIARQLCTIDQADGYSMYLHLPKELHPKEKYSDAGFFKQFCILKTPKAVLQGIADRYLITFPDGLKYTAHDNTEVHCDTLTYLEMIFTCVYMLRKPLGEETLTKWFDKYDVDYSKLVGNHKPPTLPLQPEKSVRDTIELQRTKLRDIIESASDTKGTKQVLIDNLNSVTSNLQELEESLSLFFVQE